MTVFQIVLAVLVVAVLCGTPILMSVRRSRRRRREGAANDAAFALRPSSHNAIFRPVTIYVNSRKLGELMASSIAIGATWTKITARMVLPHSDEASVDLIGAVVGAPEVAVALVTCGTLRIARGKFLSAQLDSEEKTGAAIGEFFFEGGPLTETMPFATRGRMPKDLPEPIRAPSHEFPHTTTN